MKKSVLTFAMAVSISVSSFAQTAQSVSPSNGGGKFSIGVDAGLPTGDAHQLFSSVVGGSIKYELPTAKNTFLTLSGGYQAYLIKSEFKSPGEKSSFGFVPLKAGIKYYSSDGFFLEAQAGISISTESGGSTAFAYSPGIGYTFKGGFELGARYEAWTKDGTVGQATLRLAFRF